MSVRIIRNHHMATEVQYMKLGALVKHLATFMFGEKVSSEILRSLSVGFYDWDQGGEYSTKGGMFDELKVNYILSSSNNIGDFSARTSIFTARRMKEQLKTFHRFTILLDYSHNTDGSEFLRLSRAIEVILHELVHVKQYFDMRLMNFMHLDSNSELKDLSVWVDDQGFIEKVLHPDDILTHEEYTKLPWEKEAFDSLKLRGLALRYLSYQDEYRGKISPEMIKLFD